jgi:hypothetical protein
MRPVPNETAGKLNMIAGLPPFGEPEAAIPKLNAGPEKRKNHWQWTTSFETSGCSKSSACFLGLSMIGKTVLVIPNRLPCQSPSLFSRVEGDMAHEEFERCYLEV